MTISVIIPVLDEELRIGEAIRSVSVLQPHEILVVDGGSRDATVPVASRHGCRVVTASRGRALQMNAGAALATGDILLFLHADTRLPTTAARDITAALADAGTVGGRFDVRLDGPDPVYRLIETFMNVRSRFTRIATGDQAIFVRRRVFETMGGYAPIPLMEDVEFSRRLKRRGRIACLPARVITSTRRWERDGPWRTIVRMWWLRALFAAGVAPRHLARGYAPVR
ncbi:MAG: TIGR04283 family arsenosugar biosynthesis glycosyltransferase [Nitrospirae bacterium]|nr:TIGR04283 family arsenosugar biosynthesis glycosyltransferase [Nitrospirota bacterium]